MNSVAPRHPGQILLEMLAAENTSIETLLAMGASGLSRVSETDIHEMLAGRQPMTEKMARAFSGNGFGTIAGWQEAQLAWDNSSRGRAQRSS